MIGRPCLYLRIDTLLLTRRLRFFAHSIILEVIVLLVQKSVQKSCQLFNAGKRTYSALQHRQNCLEVIFF